MTAWHMSDTVIGTQTTTEAVLAQIWSRALGVDGIRSSDHFLDLGGQSITATTVIQSIDETFEVDLPFGALFGEQAGLSDIAKLIDQLVAERT